MSAPYAAGTTVAPESSRAEIERTLRRYGAQAFMYGWDDTRAVVQFKANDRIIRFALPMPARADHPDYMAGNGRWVAGEKSYEAEVRRRWRSLANTIKAKLDAVETGIVDFEAEFLSQIVLPDDTTVGAWMVPQVAEAYRTGVMPSILPALEGPVRKQIEAP